MGLFRSVVPEAGDRSEYGKDYVSWTSFGFRSYGWLNMNVFFDLFGIE